MAMSVARLKGLSPEIGGKLKELLIKTSDQLLEAVRTPKGRQETAAKLGITPQAALELANRADLSRIKGIGGIFSDLLEEAGVDTVKELAARRADNLHAKLLEVNGVKKLAGRAPTLKMVESWVEQAKQLPKLLEY